VKKTAGCVPAGRESGFSSRDLEVADPSVGLL
jgi:hypothetical protein